MSRLRALAVLLAAGMVASVMLLPSSSAEKSQASDPKTRATDTTVVPVKGFHKNGVKAFDGDMTIKRFIKRNGKLKAVGSLDGTVFNRKGAEKGTVEDKKVKTPVNLKKASCDILRLVLGPLDLDLLGLRIELNRVVLNITAEPGPGNLLGNLLCAVAGLLDGTGLLGVIRNLLNAILEVLNLP
ncbi:MAG: hypothetical protein ACRDK3_10625 [Actinomycetota bacterium]